MSKHILIIRLSALGDVAMTVPVIYSLARQYPELKITVATRPFFRQLFVDAPANIKFALAETGSIHRGIKGLFKLIKELRSMKFDYVADFHDVLRSRLIRMALRLGGIPVAVVDKDRKGRRRLTHRKLRETQRNYVDRYADVLARLELPVKVDFKSLFPETEREGIGIAPFARYATKAYPPKLMERVVEMLVAEGRRVYLFGAHGEEAATLAKWEAAHPGAVNMAGKLSLPEELEFMSRLQVMVSMDSANMHMASLGATPVISMWGSTTPHCGFLGYGQTVDRIIYLDLPCQPCSIAGVAECPIGHYACMERIPPEDVVAKIRSIVNR